MLRSKFLHCQIQLLYEARIFHLTWVSLGLFLASSKSANSSLTALFVVITSHVEFVTLLTIKNVAIHPFLTRLFLRALGLVISRDYHLQIHISAQWVHLWDRGHFTLTMGV